MKLAEGDNPIRAECYKDGKPRGASSAQLWSVPLSDTPKAWARVIPGSDRIQLDAGASELAPARAAPIVSYRWRGRGGNRALLAELPARGQHLSIAVPPADGDYAITLRVVDALNRSDQSTVLFRVRGGKAEAVDAMQERPTWMAQAVIYGVTPKLFSAGDLASIAERLDDLAALGVTAIWLSPVTVGPPGDYGYAVTDSFKVRPEFGGDRALWTFIQAAHARRLRVLLDVVPNHLSDQHPYFTDSAAQGRASPYFKYFAHGPDGQAAHYFDWNNLKNLNYDDAEVQNLVLEAFTYWVREFDIDGFRVDAAWGPRERAPEFWPRWRRELKRIKPDLLLLAEASARDPYYVTAAFDAAYDWTGKPGEWAWQQAFDDPAHTAALLRAAIEAAPPSGVFRFLNNNDTGVRFITRYGLPRTRVASVMLMTLPGLPGLYAGDEVGAAFEPYAQPEPINWEDRLGLRDWYRQLIALRRSQPALISRDLYFVDVAPTDRVLAYLRPAPDPKDNVLILLNYGETPQNVTLPRDAVQKMAASNGLVDLLSGERFRWQSIALAGYGAQVLKAASPPSSPRPGRTMRAHLVHSKVGG
jgi:glycosidase